MIWRFQIYNLFREKFKFRGFTKAFKNFAKYIIAFISAKFKYFAKQIIYLESPDQRVLRVLLVRFSIDPISVGMFFSKDRVKIGLTITLQKVQYEDQRHIKADFLSSQKPLAAS